jgi:drug/metabolite transporter (DMT)-like permease
VVALAVFGTAAAQLLFYRLISLHGVSRTTLVSYLVPVSGLLFGAAILGEPLTVAKQLGLVLILAGVALGSGVIRQLRRAPAPQSP